jgi:anti-anti-sigma regulatory factor
MIDYYRSAVSVRFRSKGMRANDIDVARLLRFVPEKGQLLLGNERFLLFRQDAFGALRKLLYEQLGPELAPALLSQFGYRCGIGDYESLTSQYSWDSEVDRLSAGPTMHCWEGLVRATPTALSYDRARNQFEMSGVWESSYEAELHIQLFGKSAGPVCHTLTGYASGWATAFFGAPVLAIEPTCVARGDASCSFLLRTPDAFGPEADSWKKNLHFQHASLFEVSRQLAEQIATVQRQDALIRRLSTPVLEVWKDVLAVPIVGAIDEIRSHVLLESVLTAVSQRAARCVILDITGVDVVDAESASYLVKVARAAQLLGTYCVLTGISSAVATKLVETGADLSGVKTLRSLSDGIQACLRILENGVKARR